jgi:altronate dehydratase
MEPHPHSKPVAAATEPGEATAVEGLVVLDGPGAVAVTLTADAADAMADRLHIAAEQARRR